MLGGTGGGREQGVYPACCPPYLTPGRRGVTLFPSHGDTMRAMGLCPPLGPTAQALPSALTRELLCLPTGGAQPHCTPQPMWGSMASPQAKGATKGGPAKGCPVSPPHLVLAPSLPCSDAPPQPWQRCTPSSRALPPTPGKTLHQMVLNPGPPPPHPGLFLLCTRGGTAGLPPKGLFIVAPPPPIHAPHKATSGPGPGGA